MQKALLFSIRSFVVVVSCFFVKQQQTSNHKYFNFCCLQTLSEMAETLMLHRLCVVSEYAMYTFMPFSSYRTMLWRFVCSFFSRYFSRSYLVVIHIAFITTEITSTFDACVYIIFSLLSFYFSFPSLSYDCYLFVSLSPCSCPCSNT